MTRSPRASRPDPKRPVLLGTPTRDELLATWTREANPSGGDRDGFAAAVLDRLADGLPADTGHLAWATGLEASTVSQRIRAAATAGYQVEDGAIVGAALTLRPTRHRFQVRGNDLFTWCGFDALFLPPLLGEAARVSSTCPTTGEPIRLTVQADGSVVDLAPPTTVVAIVGPEVVTCCQTTGPDSDVCAQMPLLGSPEAGARWLEGRPGVAVVDLDTAGRVAAHYVGRPAA